MPCVICEKYDRKEGCLEGRTPENFFVCKGLKRKECGLITEDNCKQCADVLIVDSDINPLCKLDGKITDYYSTCKYFNKKGK